MCGARLLHWRIRSAPATRRSGLCRKLWIRFWGRSGARCKSPAPFSSLHPDLRFAAFALPRVEHSQRVVTPNRLAGCTEDNHAAFAALECGQVVVDKLIRGLLRRCARAAERADRVCQ